MTKELEALQDLSKLVFIHGGVEQYKIIETALKEYEGAKSHIEALHKERIDNELKLKALEIIVKKNVNINYLQTCRFEDYNNLVEIEEQLTQEEYDLLKKVLL